MSDSNTTCKDCQERLPDLLLDAPSVPEAISAHASNCPSCNDDLASLLATFAALDDWTVPEPSAFFDVRLQARVREAQATAPEGFIERARSFLLFSTGRHLRPALAGALALALIASGGSFVGLHGFHWTQSNQASATVNDLRVLDNNAQALQQMDQLLDDSNDEQDPPTT